MSPPGGTEENRKFCVSEREIGFAEYVAIDAENYSTLKWMAVSPLHYLHERQKRDDGIEDQAVHFRIGRAWHTLALEPEKYAAEYCVYDGVRNKRHAAYQEFLAAHPGMTVLSPVENERAHGMADGLRRHRVAMSFLEQGLCESVLTWTNRETGLAMKGRPDHAGARQVELKSTGQLDKELRRFRNSFAELMYGLQQAIYQEGLRENGLPAEGDPIMIVVQSVAPFDVVVYELPPEVIDPAHEEKIRLLERVKKCRETDCWPGIAPTVLSFSLPAWAVPDEALELTMGGEPVQW